VIGQYWPEEKQWIDSVVVYDDELAHCTEGKRLVHWRRFKTNPLMNYPGGDRYYYKKQELYPKFCSAFVGNAWATNESTSWRHLQIGPHVIWLECRSTESWMSNYGDGDWSVIGVELNSGFNPVIRRPLWAADFVIGREAYAVDFNIAPGMRGTGVEYVLHPVKIVDAFQLSFDNGVWEGMG